MASCVVPLDVLKLGRFPKRGLVPVQVPEPAVDVGISRTDLANVALEVLNVDWVETNNGRITNKFSSASEA